MNWRTSLKTPYDEELFTDLMAEAWREQPRTARVDVLAPMQLRITFDGEAARQVTIPLHHLWNALRADHNTPLEWQVQRFMQYWLSIQNGNFQVREADRPDILPAMLTRAEADAGAAPDLLSAPVAGDLCLAFQVKKDELRFYLNRRHLDELRLPLGHLKTLAFQNLARKYGPEPVWYDHGEGVRAFEVRDTDYGCTLLADEGVWRSVRVSLNIHRVLAAAPCRCHVFFADADNKAGVRRLVDKVEEVYFNGTAIPLSPAVLVRDDGPWRPWPEHR